MPVPLKSPAGTPLCQPSDQTECTLVEDHSGGFRIESLGPSGHPISERIILVGFRPGEVRPFEVRPFEARPGKVRPFEVRPFEIRLKEVRPFEVRPFEVRPGKVRIFEQR